MMTEETAEPDSKTGEEPDGQEQKEFVLRLYVGGSSPHARQAVVAVKRACEEVLSGRYELEVIDVFQQPQLAEADDVVAAPTLIRRRPLPVRRLSGDLSEPGRVLRLLSARWETGNLPPAN